MNCIDVIFFQADLAPEKLAIVTQGTAIPYGRLARGIASAQRRLEAAGLRAGHVVGLHVVHPIDHFVFACALYRMKVASATITAETGAYLDNAAFEAVLADNTEIVARKPKSRIIFVDTTWFQDKVEFDVAMRSHGRRGADPDWVCRLEWFPGDPDRPERLAAAVAITAEALEARLLAYMLALSPDWERMISIMPPESNASFMLGLAALSQGRSICYANGDIARDLIVTYKHHYLAGLAKDVYALAAAQEADYIPLPALRGAYVEGTRFPPSLVKLCLSNISPNTILSYADPAAGILAFGAAGRLKETPGAAGFVAPWAEAEITGGNGGAVAAGQEGDLRFRRKHRAGGGDWIRPGQRARLLKNNLLVIGG
jgi:hypothetical protein